MKLDLQIVIILFTILLFTILIYKANKHFEGLCDASCNLAKDCSGTDLSNCLLKLKCVPDENIK